MYQCSVASKGAAFKVLQMLHKSTDVLTGRCLQHYDINIVIKDAFMCDQHFYVVAG